MSNQSQATGAVTKPFLRAANNPLPAESDDSKVSPEESGCLIVSLNTL